MELTRNCLQCSKELKPSQNRFCTKACANRRSARVKRALKNRQDRREFNRDYIDAMCKQFRETWPESRFTPATPIEFKFVTFLWPDRFSE